ncbi:hypothetical protein [Rhizobium sp. MHM7A]|uniref:hypothetical protein n=1 Tax=Rhizobium sp. MHM7A TaxID=2583233 RepID=UPI001107001A|nr:hypothetical protein [Rhizobium sp. MHM7A]TLX15957.1 hypothetical protein FFR93_01175 [Rhizobium sp. MHM7A]
MSEHFGITTDLIHFSDAPALLGVDTNGAAPQRVYGIFVEAEMYEYEGDITQNYWLKLATSSTFDKSSSQPGAEHFMWASDVQRIDLFLGAIVSASVVKGWNRELNGKFDGYQNIAQVEFSEDATEECWDNLSCRVNSTDGGFEARLYNKHATLASIYAALSDKGIDQALDAVKELREWADKHQRLLYKSIAEKNENEPASLGMR